jgi:hypothetical protein
MIGGNADMGALDRSKTRALLASVCNGDSLPAMMSSGGWALLMGGPSDGIVPVTSQFNGGDHPPSVDGPIAGVIHSTATKALGFEGEGECESPMVNAHVLFLLSEFADGSAFVRLP